MTGLEITFFFFFSADFLFFSGDFSTLLLVGSMKRLREDEAGEAGMATASSISEYNRKLEKILLFD
jgi:hypothetical protein